MDQEIFATLEKMSSRGEPFAIATVIETVGSGSAVPGSKAIIDSNARVIAGWVGGGCVENLVRQEAMESIKEGKTRIIDLDLNDELFGVGMPCGGRMKVYIEPVLPAPVLVIAGHGKIAETLARLGRLVGFSVTVADPAATREAFPTAERVIPSGLSFSDIEIGPTSYVVVATQHKGDHLSIKKAIEGGAPYVALVASHTRSQLVFDYLVAAGVPNTALLEGNVRAPAGLDIAAQTPEEIALSIMSEIVAVRRGGSGRPMTKAKGIQLPVEQPDFANSSLNPDRAAPEKPPHSNGE
jgi:xanthine dehydrogenase accessory factor